MAHDVFISHATEDRQIAYRVCQALEEQGIRCWIAPRDVPSGVTYEEAIIDGLANSPLLILIFSASSNASPNVAREIQNACSEGSPTRIIPVRIDDTRYNSTLRYYLSSIQWLDASTPPLENHLPRLVEHVRLALPRGDKPPATVQPTTTTPVEAGTVAAPPVLKGTGDGGKIYTGTGDGRETVRGTGDGGRSRTPMLAVGVVALAIGLLSLAAYVLTRGRNDDRPRFRNSNEIASASPTPANTNPTPQPTPTAATPTPKPTPTAANPTPTAQPSPGRPDLIDFGALIAQTQIEKAFSEDEQLKFVKVSVKDGVATLTGTVWANQVRKKATEKASSVRGVQRVDNRITVRQIKVVPRPPA
jgi:hypothetical protein